MKTRTKIQRSIKPYPFLTDFGFGLPHGVKIPQRARKFKLERQKLVKSEERFEAACNWLQGIDKTTRINTRHCSYFLKHIAERRICGHLSNGVFIAAAIHSGFDFKICNHANAIFNMDEDSIQDAYEESLLYQKYPQPKEVVS